MIDTDPGQPVAVAAGCSCPLEQPRATEGVFAGDLGCAFHGLEVAMAEMEAAGLVDELGGGPIRVA